MQLSKLDITLKCILLLVREKESGESSIDSSKGLVKTILTIIKDGYGKNFIGTENQTLEDVKKILIDLLNNNSELDKSALLDSLRLALRDKDSTYLAIEKSLNTEFSQGGLKRNLLTIRSQIDLYYKEHEALQLLTKATIKVRQGVEDMSFSEYIQQVITNLEPLASKTSAKDPGVIDEIDIGDSDQTINIMGRVKKINEDGGIFKTGFKELNNMFRGGFRGGEFVVWQALQHNFKSGLTGSLAAAIPMLNDPREFLKDKTKKPLLLIISAEDDAELLLNFIYLYLYNNENKEAPDLTNLTKEEMAIYIKTRLTSKGWNVKFFRINPSEWTYRSFFNKVIELESQGFEILATLFDYLAKLPTTGCIHNGATGSDMHDMFARFRNFASSRGMLFGTPHQLSTDAKQLLRQGAVSDVNFVKEIPGKGYSETSKRLDQIWDAGFYIHKAYKDRKPILTFGWDKHRRPGSVDDKYKYFWLPFPKDKSLPILETIHNPDEIENNDLKDENDFDL